MILSKKTQLEDFLDHQQLLGLRRILEKDIRNIPFGRPDTGRRNLIFGRGGFVFPWFFPRFLDLAPDAKLYLQYHWPDLIRIPQNKIAQSMFIKSHQNATFRSDQLGSRIFPKGTYCTGHSTYNVPTYMHLEHTLMIKGILRCRQTEHIIKIMVWYSTL